MVWASKSSRRTVAVVAVVAAVFASGGLSGCARSARESGHTGPPSVVASTDVWGSVAKAVAGDDARVSSIISSGSADPHSYEASPADAAKITDASIVVFNGGGYDPWVQAVLDNHPGVPAVDAYSLLDAPTEARPANEHVFYDIRTAKAVATALATRLSEADPAHTSEYHSRAEQFGKQADEIQAAEQDLAARYPGTAVVATEPVAHYLLRSAGLNDKTPPGFATAVEQDTDPAPVDVAAMLDLITSRKVAAVIFNDQTVTEATRRVRRAAEDARVPVVPVTETLPAGRDYLAWQTDAVNRLAAALRESR